MGIFLERYLKYGDNTRESREKYRLQAIEYKCSLYLGRNFLEDCDQFVARRPDIAQKITAADRDIIDIETIEVRTQLIYGLISRAAAAAWGPSVNHS
jgi:hypothetical protein